LMIDDGFGVVEWMEKGEEKKKKREKEEYF
jgi:hypothetical protein